MKSLNAFMNHHHLSHNSLMYVIYNANIMYCSSLYKELCQRLFQVSILGVYTKMHPLILLLVLGPFVA